MKPDWHERGYPERHYDVIRSTTRYTATVTTISGTVFISLFLGSVYWRIPPVIAALACAVFLLLGLLGGIGGLLDTRHYVRIIPYFQRRIGGIDTFVAGQSLARYLKQLDVIAAENGVARLSTFGFNDDLCGETLIWHSPAEGLRTVTTVMNCLEQSADRNAVPVKVFEELQKWRHALERATTADVAFCILLLHGNSTSGHEWSVRKGSAF